MNRGPKGQQIQNFKIKKKLNKWNIPLPRGCDNVLRRCLVEEVDAGVVWRGVAHLRCSHTVLCRLVLVSYNGAPGRGKKRGWLISRMQVEQEGGNGVWEGRLG